jgi:hypothetical protein
MLAMAREFNHVFCSDLRAKGAKNCLAPDSSDSGIIGGARKADSLWFANAPIIAAEMNYDPCHHGRRNVSNWQRDADAQRRVYAESSFEASDGTLLPGNPPSEDQFVVDYADAILAATIEIVVGLPRNRDCGTARRRGHPRALSLNRT